MPEVFDPDKKKRLRPGEFLIYLRILFTYVVSSLVGLYMCWLRQFTTCVISGLVTVK